MPVSPDLDVINHYQPKFEDLWRRIAQQPESRFAKAVTLNTGCTGEVHYRDQIKPIDAVQLGTNARDGRLQATAITEIDTQKRANYPFKFAIPRHFDEFDEIFLKNQSLPTSQTFMEMKSGFNRQMDDLVIAAATGDAKTGENGSTTTELPAEQIVAVTEDGAGGAVPVPMNLAKLLEAKQKLEEAEAWGQDVDGEKAYLAINSKGLRALYDEAKVTSSDYAGELRALYFGEIDQFLGFEFIRSERLALATTTRSCFAFTKSGIALDVWSDPKFRLSIRNDYNDALQLRGTFVAGATRLEEVKVVEILCDES